MMRKYTLVLFILFCFFCAPEEGIAQCYPNKIVTSSYATGGEGAYIDEILWLTWGSTDQKVYPYGRHGQPLSVNSTSYASIDLGGGTFLCVEAEITNISGGAVNSYVPGTYTPDNDLNRGDFLDDLYNIGGANKQNKLVTGIVNRVNGTDPKATSKEKEPPKITFKAKATIVNPILESIPVRLLGLVVADAESMGSNEFIKSKANGVWTVVEVQKNIGAGAYNISKSSLVDENEQEIQFFNGNDKRTGAIAFLKFNDHAYNLSDSLSVEFTTTLKGGGFTALAIGLLTPSMDLGDAPESYGNPIHLLHNLGTTPDGININTTMDINTGIFGQEETTGYQPGSLEPTAGKYLGSTAPDADKEPMHSIDAKGDDNSGPAGENEEDAWPEELRRFSYNSNYMPGDEIIAEIKFKNGEVGDRISGWIDFDLNGTFDESERETAKIIAVDSNGDGYVTLKWIVPETRVPYTTYVRLRYFDSTEDDPTSPTSSVNYGEVEDHRMYILSPAGLNPMLPSKSKIKNNE